MAVSKHSRGSLTSPGYEPQRFRAVWITPPLNALAAPGTNRRDYSDSLCCEEFKKARVLIMSPRHTGVLLQRITRQTGPRPSSRPVSTLDVGIRLDRTSIDSKRSNTILTFFLDRSRLSTSDLFLPLLQWARRLNMTRVLRETRCRRKGSAASMFSNRSSNIPTPSEF